LPLWVMNLRDKGMVGGDTSPPDWSPICPELYAKWSATGALEGLNVHSRARTPAGARREAIRMIERFELADFAAVTNVCGLDLRDPTKDRDLVEFCVSVPLEQLSRGGTGRWLLRRAMSGVLPPEILECRAKGIQSADWFEHLTSELPKIRAEVTALAESAAVRRFVHIEALRTSVEQWPSGNWTDQALVRTHHYRLTRGTAVGMFINGSGSR
jgi:asparagine synthase (glutamine-hydrolysing)